MKLSEEILLWRSYAYDIKYHIVYPEDKFYEMVDKVEALEKELKDFIERMDTIDNMISALRNEK